MAIKQRKGTAIQLSIALLFLSFTIIYFCSRDSDITKVTKPDYKNILQTATSIVKPSSKKNTFINSLLLDKSEIDGAFDNTTITKLCKTTEWTEGLIFRCEGAEGGIANVRNVVLNCVRYAIEAGATQFIVPEILLQTSTSGPKGTPVPFTHYFDLPYFSQTLSSVCPRISIVGHVNDLYNFPSTATPVSLHPTAVTTSLLSGFILASPGNWSSEFKNFLNTTHPKPFSAAVPVLVSLNAPLLQFPLSYDDPHFVASFGRILRFREDVRRVAAGVVWAMDQKHKLGMERAMGELKGKRWYGAHLRTGDDAANAGWTTYATQQGNYVSHAQKSQLSLMYLSSTSTSDTRKFTLYAAGKNVTVETTDSLLAELVPPQGTASVGKYKPRKGSEQEWELLQGMSWDQQLLVDYEVLLRSSIFGGVWESSFSWGIAMRRHVVASGEKGWVSIAQTGVGAVLPNRLGTRNANKIEGIDGDGRLEEAHPPVELESPEPSYPMGRRAEAEPAPKPISQAAPAGSHPGFGADHPATLSSAEISLMQKLEMDSRNATGNGKPASTVHTEARLGTVAWEDGLSFVFGPVGNKAGGKGEDENAVGWRVRASLWP
ncbi:uncharacterized protein RCO7_06506 [Rhynchosporium graminicola]|uniref:Uncharacterized protein n=1 Tax=Rhynchosporium graminicola TaxID=2792576 RepID=A0A1E1KA00_9HELO|nr:uncharacterized protein RCO7_06506 [Rhynchosporium commune]